MSTLSNLAERYGALEPADLEWLHLLVGDWQMISDLAFADLVLWLPTNDGDFVAVAQVRPSTAPTVHYDDVVGSRVPDGQRVTFRQTLVELEVDDRQIARGPTDRARLGRDLDDVAD